MRMKLDEASFNIKEPVVYYYDYDLNILQLGYFDFNIAVSVIIVSDK